MSENATRATVKGSERISLHGAHAIGPVPNDERFEVTVRVRRKMPLQSTAMTSFRSDQLPAKRQYLTHEQYAATHGSDPADLAKVVAFAQKHGLVVVETSAARRSVFLSGTAANFAAAFGTTVEHYEHDGGTYRGRIGSLTVPSDLVDIIEGVFGIDDRPVAKPHFQRYKQAPSIGIQAMLLAVRLPPLNWQSSTTSRLDWTVRGSVLRLSNSVVAIAKLILKPTFRSSVFPCLMSRRSESVEQVTIPRLLIAPTAK